MRTKTLISFIWLLVCPFVIYSQTAQIEKVDGSSVPIRVGILVDCSGSQRLQLDRMIGVVKQFVETLQPGDEAFVIRFVDSEKISLVQDFTGDKDELADAADDLFIEGGQTAMIDAIDLAARHFSDTRADSATRRVMLLITDGDDRNSSKKPADVVAFLKQNQVRVFAIGISDLTVSAKMLDRFTKETGGKTYIPRTAGELSNAVIDIAKNLRGAPAGK